MKNVLLGSSVLILFGIVGGFLYSPYVALQNIDKAIQHNDATTLNTLVNMPVHRKIATTIIEGKLKVKKDIERRENKFQAWVDYGEAFKHVNNAVDSLTSPHGFKHLLKGNLDYIQKKDSIGPYQAVFEQSTISFDSLTEAHTYVKQATGLETKVILKRTRVFHWTVENLEYPIKDMLDNFVNSLTA